jgi:hypothetical protein
MQSNCNCTYLPNSANSGRETSFLCYFVYVTFSKVYFGIVSFFFIDLLLALIFFQWPSRYSSWLFTPIPFVYLHFAPLWEEGRMSLRDMLSCLTNVTNLPHLVVPCLSARFYRGGSFFILFSHKSSTLYGSTDGWVCKGLLFTEAGVNHPWWSYLNCSCSIAYTGQFCCNHVRTVAQFCTVLCSCPT